MLLRRRRQPRPPPRQRGQQRRQKQQQQRTRRLPRPLRSARVLLAPQPRAAGARLLPPPVAPVAEARRCTGCAASRDTCGQVASSALPTPTRIRVLGQWRTMPQRQQQQRLVGRRRQQQQQLRRRGQQQLQRLVRPPPLLGTAWTTARSPTRTVRSSDVAAGRGSSQQEVLRQMHSVRAMPPLARAAARVEALTATPPPAATTTMPARKTATRAARRSMARSAAAALELRRLQRGAAPRVRPLPLAELAPSPWLPRVPWARGGATKPASSSALILVVGEAAAEGEAQPQPPRPPPRASAAARTLRTRPPPRPPSSRASTRGVTRAALGARCRCRRSGSPT